MTRLAPHEPAASSPATDPFVTLAENQLAVAAIERLAEWGRQDPPTCRDEEGAPRWEAARGLVYLYGGSGLGKSHLVEQFLWNDSSRPEPPRMIHLSAAELIGRLDVALSKGQVAQLRDEFLQLDLFICEDLAAARRKNQTQRLIVTAIDETLAQGGRVLVTGPRPPGELEGTLPRLINRLHGGACVALGAPALASRVRLLLHFARLRQLSLPAEQAQSLAEQLALSPRELRAVVARLDASAQQAGLAVVNDTLVEQYLEQVVARPAPEMSQIAKAVAREFGLSVSTLRRGGRTASSTLPRHVAMSLARELTDHSLERIAGYFGRQNHGTVIHARKKFRARLADDPELRGHVRQIRLRLGVETA